MDLSTLKRLARLPLIAGLVLSAQSAFAGTLTNVSVVPTDSTPGATTTYTFSYTTDADPNSALVPDAALFYVTFPPAYSFTTVPPMAPCDRITIYLDGSLTPTMCNASYGFEPSFGVGVNQSIAEGTQIEVVVTGVINPSTPGDYTFDPAGGINLSTGIYTADVTTDPMAPDLFTAIDEAAAQTVTIGTPASSSSASSVSSVASSVASSAVSSSSAASSAAAVDGTCGIAHTGTFAVDPPSETLCETGIEASYSVNPTDYTWDCNGENGGSQVSCSASLGFLITPPVTAGGTFDCTPDLVTYGDSTTCTAAPNSGYDFSGWGAGDCNGVVTLACVVNNVVSDPVVEALFTASPTYTITTAVSPSSAAGTASCSPNPVTSGNNTSCTAIPNPGYTFTGWTGDCNGSSCSFIAVSSAKTVTANFSAITYDITGTASPLAGGSVTCSSGVTHGGSGACIASVAEGYRFTGWSNCPSVNGSICNFTNVTANQSVTANFALNSYTVTAAPLVSGTGSASCTSPVDHGSSSTCTATPAIGFHLDSWTGCTSTGTNSCSISNVTANTNVTASFTLNIYTLSGTATPSAGGKISCDPGVPHGGNGTCAATPSAGYAFDSWTGCTSTNGTNCSVVGMTDNASVSANFTINTYTVTATANPSNAGSPSCTSPVDYGTTATCTANPALGYGLKEWSGACTGSSCTIESIKANASVTANYELLPTYSVTVASVTPSRTGSVVCDKNVIQGTSATCTARPLSGYRFLAWGGDCTGNDTKVCTIENVTRNQSVSVSFEATPKVVITAQLKPVNGELVDLRVSTEDHVVTSYDKLICTGNNVELGTTVTCKLDAKYVRDGSGAPGKQLRSWGGECTRIEGSNCIIENMTTDKHIIAYAGLLSNEYLPLLPSAAAGSVWCSNYPYYLYSYPKTNVELAQEHCVAEPNEGWEFDAFTKPATFCAGARCPLVDVHFKQKTNSKVVNCENCTVSNIATDDTTIRSTNKSSGPDEQGNSNTTTVATTTNTLTGGSTTSVTVNTQTAAGPIQPGGSVSTNDPLTQITVGDRSTTLQSSNTSTGQTSSVVIGSTGATVTTSGLGGGSNLLTTLPGQDAFISQTTVDTSVRVTSGGNTLGTVSTTTDSVRVITDDSSSNFTGGEGNNTVIFGPDTVNLSATIGTLSVTSTQCTTQACQVKTATGITFADNNNSYIVNTSVGPGSAGTVAVGSDTNWSGTALSPGGSSMRVKVLGALNNPGNKPGMHKTSAAEDEHTVFVDITGDALQSVQIFTQASGVVEVFKPAANGPVLSDIVVNDDSLDMTLTFPAAQ